MDNAATIGIEKINVILESFMGIYDTELGTIKSSNSIYKKFTNAITKFDTFIEFFFQIATQIWELAEDKRNSSEFAEAIDNSDLEAFGFTDDFVIELWGAVTDARAGRHR